MRLFNDGLSLVHRRKSLHRALGTSNDVAAATDSLASCPAPGALTPLEAFGVFCAGKIKGSKKRKEAGVREEMEEFAHSAILLSLRWNRRWLATPTDAWAEKNATPNQAVRLE